jgi:hypothetical protein
MKSHVASEQGANAGDKGYADNAKTRDKERHANILRYRLAASLYLFRDDFQTALSSHVDIFFHSSFFKKGCSFPFFHFSSLVRAPAESANSAIVVRTTLQR